MKRRIHKRWPDKTIRLSQVQRADLQVKPREKLHPLLQWAIVMALAAALGKWVVVPWVAGRIWP